MSLTVLRSVTSNELFFLFVCLLFLVSSAASTQITSSSTNKDHAHAAISH